MATSFIRNVATDCDVTAIESDNGRHFLVIRYRFKAWTTLVLEHITSPDCLISREMLPYGAPDPADAVTEKLFKGRSPHAIERLKRKLSKVERESRALKVKLKRLSEGEAGIARERGLNGCGNP